MQSGRSVSPCTSGIARPINPTSSASGSPTFTSSMSAPPSTCCTTSTSSCERSPVWSCAWKALRPVGLMRSPITQNGCSGPITTVLDRDRTTVSTRLPLRTCRNAEAPAQARDARLPAKADQVQPGDAGERPRVLCELECHLEAPGLWVGRTLAPFDQRTRHGDPRHVLVHVAERVRRADQADRRDQRTLFVEAAGRGLAHERGEPRGLEAHLQLQEPRARPGLLERALDPVVVRRRARIL